MPAKAMLLYVTAPDPDCARSLARAAVEARLAACANILPGMVSLYHWEGRVEEASEVVLILKTRPELADALQALLLDQHPYQLACVLRLAVDGGNPAFLDWIGQETADHPR